MVAGSSDGLLPALVVNPNPVHRHPRPNGDAAGHTAIEPRRHLAILIDAQNVSPSWIPKILDIASQYGEVVVQRAFGVFQDKAWTQVLDWHAIQPKRRAQGPAGKNSADIELTIAAVDMLSDTRIDGYCLVSSDSDFAPLALRLRESGRFVLGIGARQTREAMLNACDVFAFIVAPDALPELPIPEARVDPLRKEFLELLAKAVDLAKREDGWADIAAVGVNLRKVKLGFKPWHYGYRTLGALIASCTAAVEMKRTSCTCLVRMRELTGASTQPA